MPQELPDGSPDWAQYLVYIAAFMATVAAGWKGWSKKTPAPEPLNTLIAGDIMDTRPMKDLVVAVGVLNERLTLMAAAEDRSAAASDRAAAASDRAATAAHQTEEALRELGRVIHQKL